MNDAGHPPLRSAAARTCRWIRTAVLAGLLAACAGGPTAPNAETCSGYPPWQASDFALPYPVGTAYRVLQGNCSGFGHSGIYAYSYDFGMDIGTPVSAAADGEVTETRTGYADGDLVPGHENFVKVLHADGTITAYSHLSQVSVTPHQAVRAGQVVGTSGNTGNTGGTPHLHFHRSVCSEPVDCGTLPVTFYNTDPNPNGLLAGHVYAAGPLGVHPPAAGAAGPAASSAPSGGDPPGGAPRPPRRLDRDRERPTARAADGPGGNGAAPPSR